MRLRGAFSLFGMKTATAIDVGAPRHDGSAGVAADILNGIICYLIGIQTYVGRVTAVTRSSSSASTRGEPSGELGSSREISPASPRGFALRPFGQRRSPNVRHPHVNRRQEHYTPLHILVCQGPTVGTDGRGS